MNAAQSSRSALRELGLRPRKRLSQSFLEDRAVAAAIVRAARLNRTEDVLEVGPGLGALTTRLSAVARRVVAVEIDPDLAAQLPRAANLTVVTADVLQFEPATVFSDDFVVVANLPYHITSPALRHLLASGPPFASRLLLMVQTEVAQRIAAQPGDMSALAVAIQAQARVEIVQRVPAAAFYPRPKVDSAVLRLQPLADNERPITRQELEPFVAFVQGGFKQPRKTLANSLADGLHITKTDATQQLVRAGLDPSKRPETLTVDEWARLFRGSS